MPTATAVHSLTTTFYVPRFEVRIRERELPDPVIRDVMQVTYRDKVGEIESFELLINNWDAEARKPKYEPPLSSDVQGLFDPGQKLELTMGYFGDKAPLTLVGEITTLEPSFPESGGPTLSVRGLNILHGFRRAQHTWAWDDKRDSDIAKEIGRQPVSRERPGLGIEVRTKPRDDEQTEPFVFMNNQYDIVFLLDRARRHNYEVVLRTERRDGRTQQVIFFGPSKSREQQPVYLLEWGKSLVSFRPTLTTANQVSQVTVRGWNRRTRQAITGTAQWGDRGLEINRDQHAVARAVTGRHEVITNRPVHTRSQARALARDILRGQLQEMVTASGATVGLPGLRAGRKVHITGVGPRFSGEYFITDTTHTIGDSGYRTTFSARRERALEGQT